MTQKTRNFIFCGVPTLFIGLLFLAYTYGVVPFQGRKIAVVVEHIEMVDGKAVKVVKLRKNIPIIAAEIRLTLDFTNPEKGRADLYYK